MPRSEPSRRKLSRRASLALLALGAAWLRMAAAAVSASANAQDPSAFYSAKIKTAHFFFTRLLPEAHHHYTAICAGAQSLMAFSPEEF